MLAELPADSRNSLVTVDTVPIILSADDVLRFKNRPQQQQTSQIKVDSVSHLFLSLLVSRKMIYSR